MDSYNLLGSQRLAVILARNLLQALAGQTISKKNPNTSFMVTEMKVKVRKRTDCTTTFSPAIAPADDITLRCNHSTSDVDENLGAARH